jgi:hypothetical protein
MYYVGMGTKVPVLAPISAHFYGQLSIFVSVPKMYVFTLPIVNIFYGYPQGMDQIIIPNRR